MAITRLGANQVNLASNVSGTLTVANGGTGATSDAYFHIYANASTDIPNNTTTKVNLQVAGIDSGGFHDSTNNRVLVPSGFTNIPFLLVWNCRLNLDGIGDNTASFLYQNSSQISADHRFYNGNTAELMQYGGSVIANLSTGDTLEIRAFQNSGTPATKATGHSTMNTSISGMRIIT